MPIYEYACTACDVSFEKLMKMNASPPACPECGAEEVRKKVSAAGFVLKGSGWYRDHYGLKSSGESSKSDKAGESSSSAGTDGSSDSGTAKPSNSNSDS